ncbi:MAG: hypothetical protein PHD68_02220 [Rugosibacter sp.]|nr:hypothetical protein [Rugosibacter sp.]
MKKRIFYMGDVSQDVTEYVESLENALAVIWAASDAGCALVRQASDCQPEELLPVGMSHHLEDEQANDTTLENMLAVAFGSMAAELGLAVGKLCKKYPWQEVRESLDTLMKFEDFWKSMDIMRKAKEYDEKNEQPTVGDPESR